MSSQLPKTDPSFQARLSSLHGHHSYPGNSRERDFLNRIFSSLNGQKEKKKKERGLHRAMAMNSIKMGFTELIRRLQEGIEERQKKEERKR